MNLGVKGGNGLDYSDGIGTGLEYGAILAEASTLDYRSE